MNFFYQRAHIIAYCHLLAASFRHCTHRALTEETSPQAVAEALYHAPFALVSHGTQPDPVFCYANQTAQDLWEMGWDEFTSLPSRFSAEPDARDERARLLARAEKEGFVDDYRGVRISKSGRRFLIEGCTLWNVTDGTERIGQAAMFTQWRWIDG